MDQEPRGEDTMSQLPPSEPKKPHRGGTILALGILALASLILGSSICIGPFIGLALGILAWVLGNEDLRLMNSGVMDENGRSLVTAGRICGMVAVGLFILGLIFVLIGMVAFMPFLKELLDQIQSLSN